MSGKPFVAQIPPACGNQKAESRKQKAEISSFLAFFWFLVSDF
jgi:hypothetical protein